MSFTFCYAWMIFILRMIFGWKHNHTFFPILRLIEFLKSFIYLVRSITRFIPRISSLIPEPMVILPSFIHDSLIIFGKLIAFNVLIQNRDYDSPLTVQFEMSFIWPF